MRALVGITATVAGVMIASSGSIAGWIASAPSPCEIVRLVGSEHVVVLHVEVADDPIQRARGLRAVVDLASDHGLLLDYPSPRPVRVTMRGMRVPLDVAFVRDGTVVRIARHVPATRTEPIASGSVVDAVVEAGAGTLRHIEVGDRVVWVGGVSPCDGFAREADRQDPHHDADARVEHAPSARPGEHRHEQAGAVAERE